MIPADQAWRGDLLEEHLPRTSNLDARMRVLKALQREYEIFLEYQQAVAALDEHPAPALGEA